MRVLDAGVERGRPFLVMEFVEGRSLRELLDELFPQDVRRQLRAALASSEAPSEKAWTLRRALDAAYAQVREGLKK